MKTINNKLVSSITILWKNGGVYKEEAYMEEPIL